MAVSLCGCTLGQQAVVRVGCGYLFLSLSSISQAVFFAWSQLQPRGEPSELIMRDCIIFFHPQIPNQKQRGKYNNNSLLPQEGNSEISPFKGKLGENREELVVPQTDRGRR